jgi:NADP-dependent 3-hydroxy acid dehydrogenase YdfG
VTNENQIAAALKAIADRHHTVDIVVNNAGILSDANRQTLSRIVQENS